MDNNNFQCTKHKQFEAIATRKSREKVYYTGYVLACTCVRVSMATMHQSLPPLETVYLAVVGFHLRSSPPTPMNTATATVGTMKKKPNTYRSYNTTTRIILELLVGLSKVPL